MTLPKPIQELIEREAEECAGVEFIRHCNNRQPSIEGAMAENKRDGYKAAAMAWAERCEALAKVLKSVNRHLKNGTITLLQIEAREALSAYRSSTSIPGMKEAE